jgi:hypothetical protein
MLKRLPSGGCQAQNPFFHQASRAAAANGTPAPCSSPQTGPRSGSLALNRGAVGQRVKVLFFHQNLPRQFLHLVPALQARGHECRGLTAASNPRQLAFSGTRYSLSARPPGAAPSPLAKTYGNIAERGVAAALAAAGLRDREGYHPDVIFGHSGWGETLFLKEVWPKAKLLVYPEFYCNGTRFNTGFDHEFNPPAFDGAIMARARSAHLGQAMLHVDAALVPTRWQASSFPPVLQGMIEVVHDGIDTARIRPNPAADLTLQPSGMVLRLGDEILTFVNRNQEPYQFDPKL